MGVKMGSSLTPIDARFAVEGLLLCLGFFAGSTEVAWFEHLILEFLWGSERRFAGFAKVLFGCLDVPLPVLVMLVEPVWASGSDVCFGSSVDLL